MIAALLKQYFDAFVVLDLAVWERFEQLGEVCHFPKETVIKPSNTVEKYMNLILKGSGGCLLWKEHNFVCTDIAFEHEFISDYTSFTLQKPTPIEVRLFEDTTVFRISHQNFQRTLLSGHHGEKVTRLIADAALIEKQQQQIDLLTKSAKERYMELQNKKGIERTSLKYLASYLGITPQSLSRIRAQKI